MARKHSTSTSGKIIGAGLAGLVAIGAYLFVTPTGANLFGLVTSEAFYIPKESSLTTFRVTLTNPGSGDWWLYGEDKENYYAISDKDHFSYLVVPKAEAPDALDPLDKTTWGSAAQLRPNLR
jgi:hypothetical protein